VNFLATSRRKRIWSPSKVLSARDGRVQGLGFPMRSPTAGAEFDIAAPCRRARTAFGPPFGEMVDAVWRGRPLFFIGPARRSNTCHRRFGPGHQFNETPLLATRVTRPRTNTPACAEAVHGRVLVRMAAETSR